LKRARRVHFRPGVPRVGPKGSLVYKLVTTTDRKLIGMMYNNRESR